MLRRTVTRVFTNKVDDTVIVLPDGLSQIISLEGLENFSDLKCRIELLYGLPYELQRLYLSDTDHPVGDWVPLNTLRDGAIFVKTEESWVTFISACLRQSQDRVLQLLDTYDDEKICENRTFVALFIASAAANKELIKDVYKRIKNVNVLNKRTASGRNLLHSAVASGDWSCIELNLLHANLDLLLAVDSSGDSPINLADKKGYSNIIQKLRDYTIIHEKMDNLDDTSRLKSKKEVSRRRGTQSLKLSVNRQLPVEISKRSLSTPTSPCVDKLKCNRLLERQTLGNSLNNLTNYDENATSSSSTEFLPRLGEAGVIKSASKQIFLDPNDGTDARTSPRSLSPSPPRNSPTNSVFFRRKSTQAVSAPVSPNLIKHGRSSMPLTPSAPPSDNKSSALQQVVFLPPWRRTSGSKLDGGGNEGRRASNANQKSLVDLQITASRRESSVAIKRSTGRSLSVACKLTEDDVRRLEGHQRLSKPWNEWRRLSIAPKYDSNEPQTKEDLVGSKKTFEEWFLDKEKERENNLAKMSDEERKKALDKEKEEQERRMRCKSFEEWSLEKEIQDEILKEEEKEKENEKQIAEAKMNERKAEAERKYEKWMMEKFQEELKREEKLEKLMQEKWKLKQQTQARKKSITSFGGKKPLTSSKSLPIV